MDTQVSEQLATPGSARAYVFTWQLPEEYQLLETGEGSELSEWLSSFIVEQTETKFAIWQLERGEETRRLHLQGYIHLSIKTSMGGVRSRHANLMAAYLKAARASPAKAIEYCRKARTRVAGPWTIGEEASCGQGKNRLREVCERICEGDDDKTIATNFPEVWLRYYKGTREYRRIQRRRDPRVGRLSVIVFYGQPRSGKTFTAKALAEAGESCYEFMFQHGGTTWWDGYNGETDILINEFSNNFPYHYALNLLDNYDVKVQTKGGMETLNAHRIWITCMDPMKLWYPNTTTHRDALYERITHIYRWEGKFALDNVVVTCEKEPTNPDAYAFSIPALPLEMPRPQQKACIDLTECDSDEPMSETLTPRAEEFPEFIFE